MKHKPMIMNGDELLDALETWSQSASDEEIAGITDLPLAGDRLDLTENQWWVIRWPEHCISTRCNSDASYNGPFETAAAAVDGLPEYAMSLAAEFELCDRGISNV